MDRFFSCVLYRFTYRFKIHHIIKRAYCVWNCMNLTHRLNSTAEFAHDFHRLPCDFSRPNTHRALPLSPSLTQCNTRTHNRNRLQFLYLYEIPESKICRCRNFRTIIGFWHAYRESCFSTVDYIVVEISTIFSVRCLSTSVSLSLSDSPLSLSGLRRM